MSDRRVAERSQLSLVLPEYEILGELGRGAMGVVLAARHRSLGRLVAIKELPQAFAADERVRKRFLREARTVAALSHPHVVVVYDFIDRDGHLALVMEQLPGGTVWDRFTTTGVTAPIACALLLSTAAGLDHAHRNGVLHRDVKPENLLFSADGQLKVTDFGMAKVVGGEKTLATADGVVLGTPAYMAPEQAEGQVVTPQADVYACGTMLYELLCGQLPFTAPTAVSMLIARVKDDAPPLAERAPALPAPIVEVTQMALARLCRDRYQAVEDFAVALGQAAVASWGEDWLSATGVTVTGSETIERASRNSIRANRRSILAGEEPARGVARSTVLDAPTLSPTPTPSTVPPTPGPGLAPAPTAPPAAAASPAVASAVAPAAASPAVAPAPASVSATGPTPVSSVPVSSVPVSSVILARQPGRRSVVDLSQISPVDMVDITTLRQPATHRRYWAAALVLLVAFAGLVAAGPRLVPASSPTLTRQDVTVNGLAISPASGGPGAVANPAPIDLSQPIVLAGLGPGGEVTVTASLFQVPLGIVGAPVSGGAATVDPVYLRWTTAGPVELDLDVDGEPIGGLVVAPAHPWWQGAAAVALGFVALFGFASVQSNLRGQRPNEFRLGPVFGLALSGNLIGLSVFVLAAMGLGVIPDVRLVAVAAALSAGAAMAYGEGSRLRRRRKRLRAGRILLR